MAIELRTGEKLIHEGGANLHRGWEAVGGHLYLTSQRLLFQSHSFNVQTGNAEIPLAEVASLRLCWTKFLGIIPVFPNSLAVHTTNGSEHRFVVHGRQAWSDAIRQQLDLGQMQERRKSR